MSSQPLTPPPVAGSFNEAVWNKLKDWLFKLTLVVNSSISSINTINSEIATIIAGSVVTSNKISSDTTILVDTSYTVASYLTVTASLTVLGNLAIVG